MTIEWWPAGATAPWEWAWRAQPGVWLAVAVVAAAPVLAGRLGASSGRSVIARPRAQWLLWGAGVCLLWLGLDWPIGTLAAGYLVSAAAAQYLVITLVVAPLLLAGWPVPARAARGSTLLGRVLGAVGRPPLGAIAFAVVLFGTHTPAIADELRPYAAGTLAIEAAWLRAALLLWMPVVGPQGSRGRLSYLAATAYLFVPFILPKVPGLVFTVVSEPLFEVYRSAPRVGGLSASADQQLGGIVLWSAGTIMVFISLGVLFARWVREDKRLQAPDSLGVPADPEVLDMLFAEPGGWAALERLVAIVDEELPAEDSGARIEFRVRATAEAPRVAVLELTAGLDADAEADLARRIEARYAAYLERLPAPRRSRVAAVLAFEVAGYGSRVA